MNQLGNILKTADFTSILGQNNIKQQLKSALLADHHILIIGAPGVGKTTLAKNVAQLLPSIEVNDCPWYCDPKQPQCPHCTGRNVKTVTISGHERFVRVQGSPDLTAEDLLGDIDPIKALEFGPLSVEAFTPGKLFKANNGILFFDEINRAPEKLQNALLQVLEEGKITLGSYDVDFHVEFILIATMNPADTNTEKLSDVLLDRFDVIHMGYPETLIIEKKIVRSKHRDSTGLLTGNIKWNPDELKNKDDVETSSLFLTGSRGTVISDDLLHFAVAFVRALRADKDLEKVPGVRATLALVARSQSVAELMGRASVVLEDIASVIISVLAHRITLKPSLRYVREADAFVSEKFAAFTVKETKNLKTTGGDRL